MSGDIDILFSDLTTKLVFKSDVGIGEIGSIKLRKTIETIDPDTGETVEDYIFTELVGVYMRFYEYRIIKVVTHVDPDITDSVIIDDTVWAINDVKFDRGTSQTKLYTIRLGTVIGSPVEYSLYLCNPLTKLLSKDGVGVGELESIKLRKIDPITGGLLVEYAVTGIISAISTMSFVKIFTPPMVTVEEQDHLVIGDKGYIITNSWRSLRASNTLEFHNVVVDGKVTING